MPSKIQLDENLWFLFICLQKSDYKVIDFNAVGQATNLKPPAARMRYTRLRRQIEGGTLIGTHGTPFSGGAEKIADAMKKRKRSPQPKNGIGRRAAGKELNSRGQRIKSEYADWSDEYETDSSSDSDSEDEMPLAKRKMSRIILNDVPPSDPSGVSTNPDGHLDMCSNPSRVYEDTSLLSNTPKHPRLSPLNVTHTLSPVLGPHWKVDPTEQSQAFSKALITKQPFKSVAHRPGHTDRSAQSFTTHIPGVIPNPFISHKSSDACAVEEGVKREVLGRSHL